MSETAQAQPTKFEAELKRKARLDTLTRLGRFTLLRTVTMMVTIVVGMFLTIMIANMGGYVDEIRRGEIREGVQQQILVDPTMKTLSNEARQKRMEEMIVVAEKRYGLDKPFAIRAVSFLGDAITLNLGRSLQMNSNSGSRQVKNIILERLPTTLLLFGSVGFILFFVQIFIALALSRSYGSFLDKFVVAMSPSSSVPGWFYGIFLILIFAAWLGWLPYGGMVSAPPPDNKLDYALSVLQHMILPAAAWTITGFFVSVYTWRTFFLIYSSEDYVEVAKAKGLAPRDLERRYILRPTLPNIVTAFAFFLIGAWTGAPIFERVFAWPGLGLVTVQAVGLYDTPVILGTTVIFAYMLAMTVFILDFVYAMVDPRVKVGG